MNHLSRRLPLYYAVCRRRYLYHYQRSAAPGLRLPLAFRLFCNILRAARYICLSPRLRVRFCCRFASFGLRRDAIDALVAVAISTSSIRMVHRATVNTARCARTLRIDTHFAGLRTTRRTRRTTYAHTRFLRTRYNVSQFVYFVDSTAH